MKKLLFITTLLICSCMPPEEKQSATASDTADAIKDDVKSDSINIAGCLEQFSTDYKRASKRPDVDEIMGELDDFDDAVKNIELPDSSKAVKKMQSKLRALLVKIQTEDFPILRKHYIKTDAERMWQIDIDVKPGGARCTDITYIGGKFASHAEIMDFHQNIHEFLERLRFRRANYKWIPHDDNFTYYKLDSKKDAEL